MTSQGTAEAISRRRSLLWSLGILGVVGFWTHPAWSDQRESTSNGPPLIAPPALTLERSAYQLAVEQVDELRSLSSSLELLRSSALAVEGTARHLGFAFARADKAISEATSSVSDASTCLGAESRLIALSSDEIESFRSAAQQSLTRAAEDFGAQTGDAVIPLVFAESAFARRFRYKRAAIELATNASAKSLECIPTLPAADSRVQSAAVAFQELRRLTISLASGVELVERTGFAVVDRAVRLNARGWLTTTASTRTFPEAPSLQALQVRVDLLEGAAHLRLPEPSGDAQIRLQQYLDAALRLAVEDDARQLRTQLARAATVDCEAEECRALQSKAEDQESIVLQQLRIVEEKRSRLRQAVVREPGLGVFASEPSSWEQALRSAGRGWELAVVEATAVVAFADRLDSSIRESVATALEQALVDREVAYRRIFGDFPDSVELRSELFFESSATRRLESMNSDSISSPTLTRHAFEVLSLRGAEADGYGAYTYVIFPVASPSAEYQALLDAIVDLTKPASPTSPPEVRAVTNLFEIPGVSSSPVSVSDSARYVRDIGNYDWSRALSLVEIAADGVLSSPSVLRRFRRSPGPFLLTLPVPIEQARETSSLLLADLSSFPVAGYKDLVRSYQNDLVAEFPTTQQEWVPPWNQRIALSLVSIGLTVLGQNFVVLRD